MSEIFEPLRCDYMAAGGDIAYYGCVFPLFWGTHKVPRSILLGYANHIADAQTEGLPGAPPTPGNNYPLHRIRNQSDITENRNTACQDAPSPRPAGWECDEYPPASTLEGAATSGGDYSWRLIPIEQNQAGGAHLKGFYRDYRLIARDAFYIQVVN
ncbi:NucA/NucB deoxyribonuclease domain-containing protein [Nonomuraea sp. NPDC049419]|uniref:NucA/NucB deoxyribonuclease domain-containing protein n=1 Tax=Nonomuraea sp. NPDC049419 TaxID=3155772 RepID=UPI00343DE1CF